MKKVFLLCICLFLIGCSPNLNGRWVNPDGLTEITFSEENVNFFDVEGTYKTKGNKLILVFESMSLEYEYELNGDELILFIDEDELHLERVLE